MIAIQHQIGEWHWEEWLVETQTLHKRALERINQTNQKNPTLQCSINQQTLIYPLQQ
ncbi:hypothetical protein Leryth_003323 [Lithospermum erythrorhizon]|nr:hypothetical protein Leryth_003323 [Lithospermum erythrorhizon]